MQEQPMVELLNEFLKVEFPITTTIPERVSEEAPALAAAVLPEGGKEAAKDLGVLNIANALPQSIAPAIAPIFLAIGGGGNYTALFIAAAVFALFGALSIQPVKGVR